jgi:hypothetical protein
MKTFDVQSVEIKAPFEKTFEFIRRAESLPDWTSAFESVGDGRAVMRTPAGSVTIALSVQSSRAQGTVDWLMTFPDGSVAKAFSRIIDNGPNSSIYSFVLTPPPVPLEQLEGALEQQSQILREELIRLQRLIGQ